MQETNSDAYAKAAVLLEEALAALRIDLAEDLNEGRSDTVREIRDSVLAHLLEQTSGKSRTKVKALQATEGHELLCCAMDLLEIRLEALGSHETGQIDRPLYLEIPAGPPPLPRNVGAVLDSIEGLDSELANQSWIDASEQEQVGLAAALLVMRSGACSRSILRAVFESLMEGAPVCLSEHYAWMLIDAELDGVSQKRRIFVDPATLAAMALIKGQLKRWRLPNAGSARQAALDRRIREGWSALRGRLASRLKLPGHLKALMDATSAHIQLNSVPLLATYASGRLASTSWHESAWVRMLGYDRSGSDEATSDAPGREGRGATEESVLSPSDAAISEPADGDDFLKALRRATHPQGTSAAAAEKLGSIISQQTPGTTRWFVAGWLRNLVVDARHGKRKRLRLGTVNYFRSIMASRLVAFLPERLDALGADELTDAFAELVGCIRTPDLKARVSALLRRFNAFCIREGERLPEGYKLPKVGAGQAEVSARHVSDSDYSRAMKLLKSEQDSGANREARVFLSLAYRFGARRAEILGLTLLDARRGNATCDLEIRPNAARALKTGNSLRRLPLSLLTDEEREDLRALWEMRGSVASGKRKGSVRADDQQHRQHFSREIVEETFLFLAGEGDPAGQIPEHPAAERALQALRIESGDSELHLHHLRHAFASRHVLGALLDDLPEGAAAQLPQAVLEMKELAKHFHDRVFARAGRLSRRGTMVSMALGHGSDETTYRHYVHGLELLVYATLRATRLRKAHKDVQPSFRQKEVAEAARILGRSQTTRPPKKRLLEWLSKRARKAGLRVCVYRRDPNTSRPMLDVAWAKAQPELQGLDVISESEVQFQRAAETLRLLRRWLASSPVDACNALKLLSGGPSGTGWYVLEASAARVFLHACGSAFDRRLGPDVRLPAHLRRTSDGESLLTGDKLNEVLWEKTARVELRVRDPLANKEGGRQRHHAVITWAVRAAAEYARKYLP